MFNIIYRVSAFVKYEFSFCKKETRLYYTVGSLGSWKWTMYLPSKGKGVAKRDTLGSCPFYILPLSLSKLSTYVPHAQVLHGRV